MTLRAWLVVSAAAAALTAQGCANVGAMRADQGGEPAVCAPDVCDTFDVLLDEWTARLFSQSPELGTLLSLDEETMGGPFNGRWSAQGLEARAEARTEADVFLAALEAFPDGGLDEARRLTRSVLIQRVATARDVDALVDYGDPGVSGFTVYPVTQLTGAAIQAPQLLAAQQPVRDAADAADFISRLQGIGAMFDGVIETIEADAAHGVIPPDFVLDGAIASAERFTEPSPAANPVTTTFVRKLDEARVEGADDYARLALHVMQADVYPAFGRLAEALRVLRADAVHDAGIWRLPNGDALYDGMIAIMADSDLSAAEIHDIGLAEVERVGAEIHAILDAEGIAPGTLGERLAGLSEDPRYIEPNTDAGRARILAEIQTQLDAVNAVIGGYFGTLPPLDVEVRRVPEFREAGAAPAYASPRAADGSRPGIYWINLRDTATWPTWSLDTVTYHEANPGHLFQGGLALLEADAPIIQRIYARSNAYGEGWGLYAEYLAAEMGLYDDDPLGDVGRLRAQLWRGVRLVVDTGMHHHRWSREQAIDYMRETTGFHPTDIESEIERYAARPGQALGYMIGMLKILELRERAETALGEDFDLGAFHDVLLLDGGLPLPALEARIDQWIANGGVR